MEVCLLASNFRRLWFTYWSGPPFFRSLTAENIGIVIITLFVSWLSTYICGKIQWRTWDIVEIENEEEAANWYADPRDKILMEAFSFI